ncbi:hemerythrin-like protein [Scenedesmus sp. PABB004]|nr:hemerythrin-like protein [Scenedesmus sp. PABB004]
MAFLTHAVQTVLTKITPISGMALSKDVITLVRRTARAPPACAAPAARRRRRPRSGRAAGPMPPPPPRAAQVREDHDRVRALYEQYKLPGTQTAQKRLLAWTIIREVSIHSAKEEEVLYPALRDALGDLTPDHLLAEHQQLKELLAQLDALDPTDVSALANFDGRLQEAMQARARAPRQRRCCCAAPGARGAGAAAPDSRRAAAPPRPQLLLHHMREEEEELLPRFAAAGQTSEHLMQLGRLWEASKLHAPSRPHPWAPNTPPLNIVANASVAPLDFLRDLVRFEAAPPL